MTTMAPDPHDIVETLRGHYGDPAPPLPSTAFEFVVWELCGYLTDDAARAGVFLRLREMVGTTPAAIADADENLLAELLRSGGVYAAERTQKMRRAAGIALERFGGEPGEALALPLAAARRALARFPGIGEPGAEKILLFMGAQPLLAPESNGLRVLVRLGFAEEREGNYAATYRAAMLAIADRMPRDVSWLIDAHQLLKMHGRETCRRTNPACTTCPLRNDCAYARGDR